MLIRSPSPDVAAGPPLTNLIRWYKADSLSLSNGDPVSSWADSSGTDSPATASGFAQPTYTTGGPNGLPYIFYDGNPRALTVATVPTDGPITLVAVVYCYNGQTGYNFFLSLDKHIIGQNGGGGSTPNGGWGAYYNHNAFSGNDINDGTWRVLGAVVRNYNDIDLLINGSGLVNVTVGTGYMSEGTSFIGGRNGLQYWKGGVAELLLYTGADSSTLAAATTYARGKYAI